MRFWDSSAIIPLLVRDEHTPSAQALWRHDPIAIVWWGTPVECASALARLERDRQASPGAIDEASTRLDALQEAWLEIQPGDRLRDRAHRLLRLHPLRAADALQLAAALVAAEDQPRTLELVTFDGRLADAARREGFRVAGRGA